MQANDTQQHAVQFQAPVKKIEAETWPVDDVLALFDLPFNDLMFKAQTAHRANFPDGDVELATLLSIKTGGCEEDCGYCPQAARYDTGVEAKKCWMCAKCWTLPKPRVKTARPVSAWAQHGVHRKTATWKKLKPWCAKSKPWVWKPAPRWAC
jgi:hypothetical protein